MTDSIELGSTSRLEERLRSGCPVVMAELMPRTVRSLSDLNDLADTFQPSPDAFVVDGSAEDGVSAPVCCAQLAARGVETVLVVSTRDRNRLGLLADIRGAALSGTRNVLCRPGDHLSLGVQPGAAAVYDVDPVQLIQMIAAQADLTSLFIGAEAYPELRPLPLALIDTKKKIAAGARFLVTEPVFDMASFDEWMTAVRVGHLNEKACVIASVRALATAGEAMAVRGRYHVPSDVIARLEAADDVAEVGIEICAELAARLRDIEGLRGLLVRSSGGPKAFAEVTRRAGLSGA